MSATPQRILLSGGGTGGHIFPAIALAEAFHERLPEADIRFVGAKGGMEERLVPQAGYPLETLWIGGLYRQLSLRNIGRNLLFPFKLLSAALTSRRLLARFRPEIVAGTGGFASYPIVNAAAGGPAITAIAEQNAFPGLANRQLAPKVDLVFLGNPDAERHFRAKQMIFTGNPVRRDIGQPTHEAGCTSFGLSPDRPVLLVLGGSLGAQAINENLAAGLRELVDSGFQVLWQCGRLYADSLQEQLAPLPEGVRVLPFIREMAEAYAAADLVVARAGALTISELIIAGTPAILRSCCPPSANSWATRPNAATWPATWLPSNTRTPPNSWSITS